MKSISPLWRDGIDLRIIRHRNLLVAGWLFLCANHLVVGQIPAEGKFSWRVGDPILAVDQEKLPKSEHRWIAVKDPSIVRHKDRWHLFCTLRKNKKGNGRIRIGYLSFENWDDAKNAKWNVLRLTEGYHGAPQIFWFKPHKKWYLIYQAEDASRSLKYGPCYSTNDDITKPDQWTLPQPLYEVPQGSRAGLDFWIICDKTHAHLFHTSLNGKMWRASTQLSMFPEKGWTKPKVVLEADIFEASHTYKVQGKNQYLTVVEAIGNNRRYFKAFVADSLKGQWKALADSKEKPLASPANVANQAESWATSYSHGELIRSTYDETLTIDPDNLQLLFQGASDKDYRNRDYGQIPWRLGLLKIAN